MTDSADRPDVPDDHLRRLREVFAGLPGCVEEQAWIGVRWRAGQSTVAHVFGGEDDRIRITFRADPEEVLTFEHLGGPYFRAGWGANVVGLVLDAETDWAELGELLADSRRIQGPARPAGRTAGG